MASNRITSKRVQIDKSKATVVAVISAAVFITVFSLLSAKSLWTQRSYQSRVIDVQKTANTNLEENIKSVESLNSSYTSFIQQNVNMIGGNPSGSGEKDGDNARITLDALPSKYDFPALTSSLEKILIEKGMSIESVTGVDDEAAQSTSQNVSGPVEMPIQVSAKGSYNSIQDVINVLERSIRPFNISKLTISAEADGLNIKLDMKTYYQPENKLDIKMEEVK